MKDLLIGVLLGALAVLICFALLEIKRLDTGKQDKHKIVEVVYEQG